MIGADMKKQIWTAALVSVVFALGGCGGGSSSSDTNIIQIPALNPPPTPPPPPPPPPPPVSVRAEITKELSVYKSGVDYYKSDNYIIMNNIWGIKDRKDIVNGVDYTSKIEYSPDNLNKSISFNWDFPNKLLTESGNLVYGYPEIAWGNPLPFSGYGNASAAIAKIGDIRTLVQTYDVTLLGDKNNYSLLHDVWIFDKNGIITGEIGIFVHADEWTLKWAGPNGYFASLPNAKTVLFKDSNFSFNVVISPAKGPNGESVVNYLFTPAAPNQPINGAIDWVKIFDFLSANGGLSKSDYIRGIETGNEIHKGKGGMTVNNFSVSMTYFDPVTGQVLTF
jgi:hypothetical protein